MLKQPLWWTFFIVPLFGLITAITKWFLDYRYIHRARLECNEIGIYFTQAHEVYSLIGVVQASLGAKRCVIVRSQNGGGIPSPGATIYSSVVFESFDPPLSSCRADFQSRPMDAQQVELLSLVFQNGFHRIQVPEMGDGLLKNFYVSEGIKQVEVVKIFCSSERFVYLSLHYTHDDSAILDDPSHVYQLENFRFTLSNIFQNMEELSG